MDVTASTTTGVVNTTSATSATSATSTTTMSNDVGTASTTTGTGGAATAVNTSSTATTGTLSGFAHPGLLLTTVDIERMRTMVAGQVEPYLSGYNRLQQESRASLNYQPTPFQIVTRNTGAVGAGNTELRDDSNAAFFHAVRWVVSGEPAHAEKSAEILDA